MTAVPAASNVAGREAAIRLAGLSGALIFAFLCTSGVISRILFSEPTTMKYFATVALASYFVMVISAPKPLLAMVVVVIVVALASYVGSSVKFNFHGALRSG